MSVWFTSDLHLGHLAAAKFRPYNSSVAAHDESIVYNINKHVSRRDKLFILGDLVFSRAGWEAYDRINCENVELIIGNHDQYPNEEYTKRGIKLHGFRMYKCFWLSHCPIHPNEMYRAIGNLHGHVHYTSDSPKIEDAQYFNCNIDCNHFLPIPFEYIKERFSKL